MYPLKHFLFGFLFSLILFFFFKISLLEFFITFLSSILIDVDHYVYYIYKEKNVSLRKAYRWFVKMEKKLNSMPKKQRDHIYGGVLFLHGIEILITLLLASFFISKFFLFIFLGFTFHLCLDIIYFLKNNMRVDKISIFYDLLKFRKMKFINDIK